MAQGKGNGLSRRVLRPIVGLCLLAALLAWGLPISAGENTVDPTLRQNGLETGDLARFESVNANNGLLTIDPTRAYGGTNSARASYLGAGLPGSARAGFSVNWYDGDEVWYGAAYYLPAGFKAAQQSDVQILGWDNRLSNGPGGDYSGVVLSDGDGRAYLVSGNGSRRRPIAGPVDVPEGRWFFLEVRQRLSQGDALNEIYLDGGLVAASQQSNFFGRPVDRVRYGLLEIAQLLPATLWFDRAVAREIEPGGACNFYISALPSQARGDLQNNYIVTAKHVGDWPVACWRPFSDDSPFNQKLDGGARIAPDSSQVISNLASAGPVNNGRAGIADTSQDYYTPAFFAGSNDPEYTIHGGSSTPPFEVDGEKVRMPDGARPAAGSDHHLTIVYNGYEYGFWDASVDESARTISISAGRKVPIDGSGIDAAGTASRFANLAGRIRYQELESGQINHALFATSNVLAGNGAFVYPAKKGSTNHPELREEDGWPEMGARIRLDPSYATDQWLAQFPVWKQAVLRAMRDYGAYFGDDSGSPLTVASFESGTGYTAFGLPDPFETYAQSHLGQDIFSSGGVYYYDIRSGVDWSNLQVVDSCVAENGC